MPRSLPFEELKRRAHINAAARAADQAPDFSRPIQGPAFPDNATPWERDDADAHAGNGAETEDPDEPPNPRTSH